MSILIWIVFFTIHTGVISTDFLNSLLQQLTKKIINILDTYAQSVQKKDAQPFGHSRRNTQRMQCFQDAILHLLQIPKSEVSYSENEMQDEERREEILERKERNMIPNYPILTVVGQITTVASTSRRKRLRTETFTQRF